MQVLLSAMFLENHCFIDSLGITGNCVVVNQCEREGCRRIRDGGREILYLETKERGLSKSRNMAIENAEDEICILCDNDVEYVENYEEIITSAFQRNPEADILVFYIRRKEKPAPLFSKEKDMDYLSVMKIFSPEIAFRKKAVGRRPFDERFGAGAEYAMGEENIFLFDMLRRGRRIRYVPVKIASLKETESTWFQGYTEKFFRDRGAGYQAMTSRFSLFLILQFALRKYRLYQQEITFNRALSLMLAGRREYRKR